MLFSSSSHICEWRDRMPAPFPYPHCIGLVEFAEFGQK
jgi:hypothetical protein